MPREFIITAISSSNLEYDKIVEQVPVILSIPGAVSLRSRSEAYKVFLSKPEGT